MKIKSVAFVLISLILLTGVSVHCQEDASIDQTGNLKTLSLKFTSKSDN